MPATFGQRSQNCSSFIAGTARSYNLWFPRSVFIVIHKYLRDVVIPTVRYLALAGKHADRQTFQVFTGAAPGGSSTSAIHGSRKTWKV